MCWLFLKKPNSKIICMVEGPRQYSADLPQGGMKVTVILKVTGNETEVNKIYKLLKWHQLVPALMLSMLNSNNPYFIMI